MQERVAVFLPRINLISGLEISLARNLKDLKKEGREITIYTEHPGSENSLFEGTSIKALERVKPSDGPLYMEHLFFKACKGVAYIINKACGRTPARDNFVFYCKSKQYRRVKGSFDIAISYNGVSGIDPYYVAYRVKAKKKVLRLCVDFEDVHFLKKAWSKYDNVICLSGAMKKHYEALMIPDQDVQVKMNRIDREELLAKAQEGNPFEGVPGLKIVSAGRLQYQKGFDIAAETCAILVKRGLDVKWFICGEGGARPELEERIRRLGIERNFILLGHKDNPYPYMMNCDLYVQPSRYEGLCNATREAMILGKFCITSDVSGMRDLITDSRKGIIVKNLSPKDFANEIERYWKNEEKTAF